VFTNFLLTSAFSLQAGLIYLSIFIILKYKMNHFLSWKITPWNQSQYRKRVEYLVFTFLHCLGVDQTKEG
jgi:hypothetical protein